MSLSDAQMVADLLQAVVTSAAVVIGAVWAYYKFIKGRTFKPNLEVGIVGEARRTNGVIYLVSIVNVKNIGASKVDIQRRRTVLRVLAAKATPDAGAFENIEWEHLETKFALGSRTRLESGGSAVDTDLFRVADSGYIAFRLEILVSSSKDDLWVGVGIVNLVSKSDNEA